MKHHFVPVFYTKRWVDPADGRLCEYSRPHDAVRPKRKHPDATGYESGLYSLDEHPPEQQQAIEEGFLRKTDQDASDALLWMVGPRAAEPMPARLREGWSRFIMSMMQRSPAKLEWMVDEIVKQVPETLEQLRPQYDELKSLDDLATFDEYKKRRLTEDDRPYYQARRALLMQRLSNLSNVGSHLNQMTWDILRFGTNQRWPLLTSDRPVIMTGGLRYASSAVLVALGPKTLFLAANNRQTLDAFGGASNRREFVAAHNREVVTQAERFVYGTDDRQLTFVEKHFRKRNNPPQYRPLG